MDFGWLVLTVDPHSVASPVNGSLPLSSGPLDVNSDWALFLFLARFFLHNSTRKCIFFALSVIWVVILIYLGWRPLTSINISFFLALFVFYVNFTYLFWICVETTAGAPHEYVWRCTKSTTSISFCPEWELKCRAIIQICFLFQTLSMLFIWASFTLFGGVWASFYSFFLSLCLLDYGTIYLKFCNFTFFNALSVRN